MNVFKFTFSLLPCVYSRVEMTDWYVWNKDLKAIKLQEPETFSWNNLPKTAYASSIKFCDSLQPIDHIVYTIKNFCNDK